MTWNIIGTNITSHTNWKNSIIFHSERSRRNVFLSSIHTQSILCVARRTWAPLSLFSNIFLDIEHSVVRIPTLSWLKLSEKKKNIWVVLCQTSVLSIYLYRYLITTPLPTIWSFVISIEKKPFLQVIGVLGSNSKILLNPHQVIPSSFKFPEWRKQMVPTVLKSLSQNYSKWQLIKAKRMSDFESLQFLTGFPWTLKSCIIFSIL